MHGALVLFSNNAERARGGSPGATTPVFTDAQMHAYAADERERCAKLRTVAAQVLRDMQAQGVLLEWQTLLDEALMA